MNSNNQIVVPEAKNAMEQFKMQAASEVGVPLKQGYNGDLTSRQAGSIGGQMVKKMIESYESSLKYPSFAADPAKIKRCVQILFGLHAPFLVKTIFLAA